jgi:hypothetical protein
MDKPKDAAKQFRIVWFLLEPHNLDVDPFNTFIGLGKKLAE